MIIKKQSITSTNRLNIGYELNDFVAPFPYPISNIQALKVKGYFIKTKDNDIESTLTVSGNVFLRDSRDDSIFEEKINVNESFLLFEEDDGEKEGYLIENNEINLNQLAIQIILASLPIKVLKPNSSLPKSGEGYSVSTDEIQKENKPYNPAFDKLKDLDF